MTGPGARTGADESGRGGAWIDLCWRAVTGEAQGLYPAVEALLHAHVGDPDTLVSAADRYRYHAIRAVLHEAAGRPGDARRSARDALVAKGLEGQGYRFHPRPGLVHDQDGGLDARLIRLAE